MFLSPFNKWGTSYRGMISWFSISNPNVLLSLPSLIYFILVSLYNRLIAAILVGAWSQIVDTTAKPVDWTAFIIFLNYNWQIGTIHGTIG